MRKFLFLFTALLLPIMFVSCERDDDEPIIIKGELQPRLYVSTSDYLGGSSNRLNNVFAVDSADSEGGMSSTNITSFLSGAMGGRTIHYAPTSDGLLFQSAMNPPGMFDTSIYVMKISEKGLVSQSNVIPNRRFDNIRGLAYSVINSGQVSAEYLVAANSSDNLDYAELFAFDKPTSAVGFKRPRFSIRLDYTPWGLKMEGKDLFVVKTGDKGGIVVYKDFGEKLINGKDSVWNDLNPSYTLTIEDSKNLGGIAYSKVKDILMVTDYDGVGSTAVGRILIFDEFSKYNKSESITPSRIIAGDATSLKQPLDVAIDGRDNGKYFFVADPVKRSVLRYFINDDGNVKPDFEIVIKDSKTDQIRTPQSISLDAR